MLLSSKALSCSTGWLPSPSLTGDAAISFRPLTWVFGLCSHCVLGSGFRVASCQAAAGKWTPSLSGRWLLETAIITLRYSRRWGGAVLVCIVWEQALCKHIDPSAFWATLISYRAVSPSCKNSWCLQYWGLWSSCIIGCPCFHPLTSLVMQRTPLTYPLCPFLLTFQCVFQQASFSPLLHPMVFISVVACRSSFLFKAWLFPLCVFPLLGSIASSGKP